MAFFILSAPSDNHGVHGKDKNWAPTEAKWAIFFSDTIVPAVLPLEIIFLMLSSTIFVTSGDPAPPNNPIDCAKSPGAT